MGWGWRACIFSSCFVHASPDLLLLLLLLGSSFSFLVLPVVFFPLVVQFPLLVPTMHGGDGPAEPPSPFFNRLSFDPHSLCNMLYF